MHTGSTVSAARVRVTAMIAGVLVCTAALSACTVVPDVEKVELPGTAAAPATPSPDAPVLMADGTAAENLPLFAAVTAQVWASDEHAQGRAYIDALVAAGFGKDRMQVTADRTTVGNPVESLQFSVAWGEEECLVGQVGPSTGDPVTIVVPQLAEGRCLVGTTRDIDW